MMSDEEDSLRESLNAAIDRWSHGPFSGTLGAWGDLEAALNKWAEFRARPAAVPVSPVIVPANAAAIQQQEAWAIISPTTGRAIISSFRSSKMARYARAVRDYGDSDAAEFKRLGYRLAKMKIALEAE